MSNFWQRAATGAVLAAAVLGALAAGPTWWRILLFIIAVGCVGEYARMKPRGFWATAGGAAAIVFCVSIMRYLPGRVALATVLVVWANDVFAYITGMLLGKHRMAPTVSPRKSWEGFAGGVVGAMCVAVAAGRWLGGLSGGLFGGDGGGVTDGWLGWIVGSNGTVGDGLWSQSWLVWAGFGLAVALAAVGGDLLESWVKRRAGVKDSGRVFPGHGGFLDRFDALLGAAPVAYVFMKLFLG